MIDLEREILAEALLDMHCLMSTLANLLYPDTLMAKDRERRLREEGGPFIARIEAAAQARIARLERLERDNR